MQYIYKCEGGGEGGEGGGVALRYILHLYLKFFQPFHSTIDG